MNKKIVLAVLSLGDGGAERVVSVWANELNARGYDVSILVFKRCRDEYRIAEGIAIEAVAQDEKEYLAMSFTQRLKKVRAILRRIRPDYVIPFLFTAQIWMLLGCFGMKTKRIETIRNNPWRIGPGNPAAKFLWKLCYRTADGIVVQAKDQIPFFSASEQKKCVLIPNPINHLYVENYREGTAETPAQFIAAGRIAPQKNYPMMIRAFAIAARKHPEISLNIFGAGTESYTEEIRSLIAETGMEGRIRLMGRSPSMEREYKKADVFLMSSDYEGLPNTLAEAMASRLICISTDCKTGPADLVDDGKNGFLSPTGDENAFAEKIERVLGMTADERRVMADSAREKILTYCSQSNSVDRLCEVLK